MKDLKGKIITGVSAIVTCALVSTAIKKVVKIKKQKDERKEQNDIYEEVVIDEYTVK